MLPHDRLEHNWVGKTSTKIYETFLSSVEIGTVNAVHKPTFRVHHKNGTSLWTHRTRRHNVSTTTHMFSSPCNCIANTVINTNLWHSVLINYCSDMFRPRFLAIIREHIGVLTCAVSWHIRQSGMRWRRRRYSTNLHGVTHYRTTTWQTAAAKATPPHIHTVWATAECWYI
jgi:hypothetical protein